MVSTDNLLRMPIGIVIEPAALTQARKGAGLSMRQLAQKAGVSHSQVSHYENGQRRPTHKTLSKVARACHVPVRALRQGGGPA